jgi:hypothetical protein
MIIEIKVFDYRGRLNHESYNLLDLEDSYFEEEIEHFWNVANKDNLSNSISEYLMRLLAKEIHKKIKGE